MPSDTEFWQAQALRKKARLAFEESWPRLPIFLTSFGDPTVEDYDEATEVGYDRAVRAWDEATCRRIARSSGAERLPSLFQAGAAFLAETQEEFPLLGMQEVANRSWNWSVEECRAWFAWTLDVMADEYNREEAHWAHFSRFLRLDEFWPAPIDERILAQYPGTTYEVWKALPLQIAACAQVAREYGQSADLATIQLVLQEGREVLKRGATFPLEHIFDIHLRFFETEAEWRTYLTGLLDVLEEEFRKRLG